MRDETKSCVHKRTFYVIFIKSTNTLKLGKAQVGGGTLALKSHVVKEQIKAQA